MGEQEMIVPSPQWTEGERMNLTVHFAQQLQHYATKVRSEVSGKLVADIMGRIIELQTGSTRGLERRRKEILQSFYDAVAEHT